MGATLPRDAVSGPAWRCHLQSHVVTHPTTHKAGWGPHSYQWQQAGVVPRVFSSSPGFWEAVFHRAHGSWIAGPWVML